MISKDISSSGGLVVDQAARIFPRPSVSGSTGYALQRRFDNPTSAGDAESK